MKHVWALIVVAGLAGGIAGLVAQEPQAAEADARQGAITGVWTLNKDLSDMPGREGARPGMGAMPGGAGGGSMPGGGGRGGMGGGRPGMGGGNSGGSRDRDDARRARSLIQDLVAPAGGLTIVRDATHVSITTADGRPLKLQANGKEEERLTGDGVIKSKTRWSGDQLVIEERIQDGPRVTRTYIASSDHRQLTVIVRIEGGDLPGQVLVHFVYDRKTG